MSHLSAAVEPPLEILLIEDNPLDARIIRMFLEAGLQRPFHLTCVDRLMAGLDFLSDHAVHLALLDLFLPDSQGIETFLNLYSHSGQVPVVVLSGLDDEEAAMLAVSRGAQDFIRKGTFDADTLSRSVRFAIERSLRQRVERELQTAELIQRRLYPTCGPQLASIDIAGAAYPADRTCGDYFDFIPIPGGKCAVVIGDVSGHGLGPALLMVETRAYLHALSRTISQPGEMLTEVNCLLAGIPPGRFVSLFCGVIDPHTRTITYASAGHPGYVLRDGRFLELPSTGAVLGLFPDQSIESSSPLAYEPGDLLLLMTDGLHEAASPDGRMFGKQQAHDIVRANRSATAQEIIAELYRAVRDFTGRETQADDVAVVIVKS